MFQRALELVSAPVAMGSGGGGGGTQPPGKPGKVGHSAAKLYSTALERLWHVLLGQPAVLPRRASLHSVVPGWAAQQRKERALEGGALVLPAQAPS